MFLPPVSCVEWLEPRRLLAAGAPDPSFSGDGTETYSFDGPQSERAEAVLLQPDGKIVALALTSGREVNTDLLLSRFHEDGSPDLSFGDGGRAAFALSGRYLSWSSVVEDALIQPDGKIVIAANLENRPTVFRFTAEGDPDLGFGNAGVRSYYFPESAWATDLLLLPGGKMLLAGHADPDAAPPSLLDFFLLRLHADGSRDTSFGTDHGVVYTDFEGQDLLARVTLDASGKILAAGTRGYGLHATVMLARYLPDGDLDQSFADGGKLVTYAGGATPAIHSLHTLPGGRIVAAGSSGGDAMLLRFKRSGRLDTGFDGDGRHVLDLGSERDYARVLRAGPGRVTILAVSEVDSGYPPVINTTLSLQAVRRDGSIASRADTEIVGAVSPRRAATLDPSGRALVLSTSRSPGGHGDDAVLWRFLSDGSADEDFAENGSRAVGMEGPYETWPLDLLVEPDGKSLVLVKVTMPGYSRWVLQRVNADGSPDASFGDAGRLWLPQFGEYSAIARQADGMILVGGSGGVMADGARQPLGVLRLRPDGSPDPAWGDRGVALLPGGHQPRVFVPTPDGGLLVGAGSVYSGGHFSITRVRSDGSLVRSFGRRGVAKAHFDYNDRIERLVLHPDGRVTAVGESMPWVDLATLPPYRSSITIARFTPRGRLDPGFSGNGKRRFTELGLQLFDVRLLPDRQLMVLGGITVDHPYLSDSLLMLRVGAAGSTQGTTTRRFDEPVMDALFEPDGSIVLFLEASTRRLRPDASDDAGSPHIPRPFAWLKQLTADGKLVTADRDEDGDLVVSRSLLT